MVFLILSLVKKRSLSTLIISFLMAPQKFKLLQNTYKEATKTTYTFLQANGIKNISMKLSQNVVKLLGKGGFDNSLYGNPGGQYSGD